MNEDKSSFIIGFIGAGKMAQALIKPIVKSSIVSEIIASNRNKDQLEKLMGIGNIVVTENNIEVVEKSDILFLCVKPSQIEELLAQIKDHIDDQSHAQSFNGTCSLSFWMCCDIHIFRYL